MATAEAELILRLRDEASKGLDAIVAHLKKVEEQGKANAAALKQQQERLDDFKGSVEGAAEALGGQFAGALGSVGQAMSALGPAGIAAAAAVGAMVLSFKAAGDAVAHLVEVGSQIKDLSERSGIAAEALQQFGYAAKLTGASTENFVNALRIMQVNLTNNEDKFKRLGLSISELRGLKPEDQFLKVADAIKGIQDPAQQTAAAIDVFGRSATAILPAIKEGLSGLSQEAKDLGGVLGGDTVNAADALGDAGTRLNVAWEGVKNQLAAVIVANPELAQALNNVAAGVGAMAASIAQNKDDIVGFFRFFFGADLKGLEIITAFFKGAAKDVQGLAAAFKGLGPEIKTATSFGGGGQDPFAKIWESATTESKKSLDLQVAAAKKAATEHESQAKHSQEAWQHAAEQSRKEWDRFFLDMEKRGIRTLGEMQKDINKQVKEMAEAQAKAAIDRLTKESEAVAAIQAAADKANEASRKKREEEHAAWLANLHDLAGALHAVGDEVGGFLGGLVNLGAAGVDVFARLNDSAVQHASTLQKVAGAAQAAVGAFQGGSVLGGAAQGALAGAAWGPLGAGIGAVAGGLLGLFGKAAKARKELAQLRGEVLNQFGGMTNLKKAADSVGISIDKAFSTKSPAEAKRIFDSLNQALEEKKKRLEGINTAIGGLELLTRGFAATMERAGAATDQTQASFTRLGNFAVATFAGLVRETGDVIGALDQMGPSLDSLGKMMADFGFQASGAFARLLSLRDVVTSNQDVADSISGLNQLMKGMGDAGLITRDILLDMGAQAAANFDLLIQRGVDANSAMALMQPTLQQLWERQQQLGVTYDENTQKLLDNAEAQGLVGEQFLDTNEQILEVLKILVETLGGQLPDALRRMGDAATDQFDRMQRAADDAAASVGQVGGGTFREAEGSFATGIREVPRPMVARLHTGEEVVPASDRGARRSRGPAQVIVLQPAPIILDGRLVGKSTQRRIESGDISPKSFLRRRSR